MTVRDRVRGLVARLPRRTRQISGDAAMHAPHPLAKLVRGGHELLVALVVVTTAPVCVTWAREAFTTEKPRLQAPAMVTLVPIGEPEALQRRYGLSVVAMPAPPSRAAMADIHEASVLTSRAESREPTSENREPKTEIRDPRSEIRDPNSEIRDPTSEIRDPTSDLARFSCPQVRAIVTGDDAFAIIAWGETSYVAKAGQVLETPVGDVKLQRLRPRSLTLTHGDDTLQCSLKR